MVIISLLILIAQLIWFFLSAGVANMAPVIFKKRFKMLAKPVDCGVQFKGKPLFGDHKTWRGMLVAVVCGGLFYLLQYELTSQFPALVNWAPFDITAGPWWFGFIFGAGAITGDLVKSFFKRRISIAPGKSWFPFDQIDFLVGAAIIASFFYQITWPMWIILILLGPAFHILFNHIGFWLKIKDNAW
ncbi:CDP-archaeol synthase [Patescibacteria group bacterium]